MRRSLIGGLAAAAALGLGLSASAAPPAAERPQPSRKKKPKPKPSIFRSSPVAKGSIAQGNRRGGEHQNSREIQRRLRQAERRAARQSSD